MRKSAPPGTCVAASCVVPGLLQGWMGLRPITGSYDTEEEVIEALWKEHDLAAKRSAALFEKLKKKNKQEE